MVARPRTGSALALGLLLLLFCAGTALAKPGEVDGRYGYNGAVDVTEALTGAGVAGGALDAAAGPLNESVVLGYSTKACAGPGTCAELHAARVLADGTIDPTFGARAGIVASVEWGQNPPNGAIAVQADGKFVVTAGDGASAKVFRLNADGSLDASFQNPSIQLGGPALVTDLAVRGSGEIVVSGASGGSFFVTQLLAGGQFDSRFGAQGTHVDNFRPGALPGGLLLRGATTLVGGNACCALSNPMGLAKLGSSGAVEKFVKVKLPKGLEAGKSQGVADVSAGPKGTTFVIGTATKGTFVAKYLGSGRPDKSFGKGGFVRVGGLRSEPGSALVDSRGRIIVLGSRFDVPDTSGFRGRFVSTVRLLPSGRLDQSYGGARPLLVVEQAGLKVGLDFSRSLALSERPDGSLIMLGEAPPDRYAKTPSVTRFGLARFLAGGPLKK